MKRRARTRRRRVRTAATRRPGAPRADAQPSEHGASAARRDARALLSAQRRLRRPGGGIEATRVMRAAPRELSSFRAFGILQPPRTAAAAPGWPSAAWRRRGGRRRRLGRRAGVPLLATRRRRRRPARRTRLGATTRRSRPGAPAHALPRRARTRSSAYGAANGAEHARRAGAAAEPGRGGVVSEFSEALNSARPRPPPGGPLRRATTPRRAAGRGARARLAAARRARCRVRGLGRQFRLQQTARARRRGLVRREPVDAERGVGRTSPAARRALAEFGLEEETALGGGGRPAASSSRVRRREVVEWREHDVVKRSSWVAQCTCPRARPRPSTPMRVVLRRVARIETLRQNTRSRRRRPST